MGLWKGSGREEMGGSLPKNKISTVLETFIILCYFETEWSDIKANIQGFDYNLWFILSVYIPREVSNAC